MRVLAVDYGLKRIGLAVSDPLEITSNPLLVLENKGDLDAVLQEIARIVSEEEADEVVVGLPVNMDGSHGPAAQAAEEFAQALATRVNVPVHTFDERLTTVEATNTLIAKSVSRSRRRRVIDKMAAAVILEDYLRSRGRSAL